MDFLSLTGGCTGLSESIRVKCQIVENLLSALQLKSTFFLLKMMPVKIEQIVQLMVNSFVNWNSFLIITVASIVDFVMVNIYKIWAWSYKTFVMFNSTEHGLPTANNN